VEPLLLRAENGQIPELKRVIVASGDKIIMRETLAEALVDLFEDQEEPPTASTPASTATEPAPSQPDTDAVPPAAETVPDIELADQTVGQLARQAADHYDAAQQALQEGDWTTYGEELRQMEAALEALVELTGEAAAGGSE
jgi:uncharacterized membrane protein (UPF0182 family)